MWGIETTWAEETHSHTGAGTDQGREGSPVSLNNATSITGSDANAAGGIPEVEGEVGVLEESDTILLEWSGDKLSDQFQVVICTSCIGRFCGLSLFDLVWGRSLNWSRSSQNRGGKGGQEGNRMEMHFRRLIEYLLYILLLCRRTQRYPFLYSEEEEEREEERTNPMKENREGEVSEEA